MIRLTGQTPRGDEPLTIEVDAMIQGHLLWQAAADLRTAYTKLTNVLHSLSDQQGGPNDRPLHNAVAHQSVPEDASANLEWVAANATGAAAEIQDALRRMALFSKGEVYDALIDPALLGPHVDESGTLRRLFVDNKGERGHATYVLEVNSGLAVYMGVNAEVDGGQPFVAISCDELWDQYVTESGEPKLLVSVGDGEVYDNGSE